MNKFENGTVVRLKSGGQLMTTEENYNSSEVKCIWFDESNEPRMMTFPEVVLEEVKPS